MGCVCLYIKTNQLQIDDTKYKAAIYCKKIEGDLALIDSEMRRFMSSTILYTMHLMRYKVEGNDWFCANAELTNGDKITKLEGEIHCEIDVAPKDEYKDCGEHYQWKDDHGSPKDILYSKIIDEVSGKTICAEFAILKVLSQTKI